MTNSKMTDKNIYILYGGPSSEHDVSVKSKDYFALLLKEYRPQLVLWTKDNTFVVNNKVLELEDFLVAIKNSQGIIVNATHGEFGEDGWIQEKLEKASIPFSGSDSISSHLAMDKQASQKAVQGIVKTIQTYAFYANKFDIKLMQKALGTSFPLFIKPNAKGSSVGVTKVHNQKELISAIAEITIPLEMYLIQPAIEGKEFSIGTVLDNGEYYDLPATEIRPKSEFFDYEAKYSDGGSEEITPAPIDTKLMNNLKAAANAIHSRLGLGYYSRTDFIVTKDNQLFYLETNSLPGMTATSLLPQQLKYIHLIEKFTQGLLNNLITSKTHA
jgi:D-alanine-D-alanine ligase